MLKGVDLSCCGVNFGYNGLKESCKDAIFHCHYKIFDVIETSEMYSSSRIIDRTHKLIDRGWQDLQRMDKIEYLNKKTQYERIQKLSTILKK
jgi:hypothetical protein